MSGTPLALALFGGSTLDSTATLDANSNATTSAFNNANSFSNPLVDTSGAANLITVQQAAGLTAPYVFGLLIFIKIANTTTATAVTINLNGQGAKTVLLPGAVVPPIGVFVTGGVYGFIYDGTNFQAIGASTLNLLTANNTWTGNNVFGAGAGVSVTVNGVANSASLSVVSGSVATAPNPDFQVVRAGSTQNAIEEGPNLLLFDSVNATSTVIQNSGGQTELWQYNGGWHQVLKVLSTWGIVINLVGGQSLAIGGTLTTLGPVAAAQVDITADESSYVPTVGGFTAAPTPVVFWSRNGKQATVFIPAILSTSNGTGFTLSIPAAIQPARAQFVGVPVGFSTDNSALINDCVLEVGLTQFQFFHGGSANGWTAAGLKGSGGFAFNYLLN